MQLTRSDGATAARVEHRLAIRATTDGAACGFYAAAVAELLRHLACYDGVVIHPRCCARGDDRCEWRTTAERGAR